MSKNYCKTCRKDTQSDGHGRCTECDNEYVLFMGKTEIHLCYVTEIANGSAYTHVAMAFLNDKNAHTWEDGLRKNINVIIAGGEINQKMVRDLEKFGLIYPEYGMGELVQGIDNRWYISEDYFKNLQFHIVNHKVDDIHDDIKFPEWVT